MHGSERRGSRHAMNVWPGWVDALSSLIMVIIFVLMIFVVAQFYLVQTLSGRDAAMVRLNQRIAELSEQLGVERQTGADLRANLAQLSGQLQASLATREKLGADLTAARDDRDQTAAKLAALSRRADAAAGEAGKVGRDLEDAYKTIDADREKIEAQLRELAGLQAELRALRAERDARIRDLEVAAESTRAVLDAEKQSGAAERARVAALTAEIEALRQQLARLTAALGVSESRAGTQAAQIEDLSGRLAKALASKVEELARYRSEFFGRLRETLGARPDIRIVGDRFVFQSEVLFPTGSATLQDAGKGQLLELARTLLDIARSIPPDVNWILRVDGHTDTRRIATQQFPSNWELSTGRAISVVKFLVEQGVPSERLAATGFGEFQPLDGGPGEDAFARNRRIELKLDQR